jgi:hypothetical protein
VEIVPLHGGGQRLDTESFRVFTNKEVGAFYWTLVAVIVLASLGLTWRRSYAGRRPAALS